MIRVNNSRKLYKQLKDFSFYSHRKPGGVVDNQKPNIKAMLNSGLWTLRPQKPYAWSGRGIRICAGLPINFFY